ncbi:MAG: LysR family transcriptional regulator [Pseudomonadota bacterium]
MKPQLEIRHLELLRALEANDTIVGAAEALLVTPSALSHRIKEAERRLDTQLFERQGRYLRRTPAGDILLEGAKRVLDDLARYEQAATAVSSGVHHFVHMTVGIYNCYHWLPAFMSMFRDAHPEIELSIDGEGGLAPFEKMDTSALDIVITPSSRKPNYAEAVPLFDDELVAILSSDNTLASNDQITSEDLANETYFTYSHEREPGFEADRVWAHSEVLPAREVTIGSIDAICEMIRAGLGVSILSRWALRQQLRAGGLTAVQVEDGVDIRWKAVIRQDLPPDSPVRTVTTALADWFRPVPHPS